MKTEVKLLEGGNSPILKVFVTGATGFIGGSVANQLVAEGYQVSGLVRSEDKVPLLKKRGITPVLGTLEDVEVLTKAAQAADAVIHAASADHPTSTVTLVSALEKSGKLFISTSGTAVVADLADGEYAGTKFYTEDCFWEPVVYSRARVGVNRYVRQAAIEKGVRTVVICPSMIYGTGKGMQPNSDHIPKLIEVSRQFGAGVYFGKGLNRYSNVHIDDLVDLYLLAIKKAPGGSFFFAEDGHNSFKEIAGMISTYLGYNGKTISMSVLDVIKQYGESIRLGVASNSLVNAVNARLLGWSPSAPSLVEYFETLK